MSSETSQKLGHEDQAAWDRVYTAVLERWPEINQLELLECKQEVDSIVEFVDREVEASEEEVRGLVAELAPSEPSTLESVIEPVAKATSRTLERVQYEISERPVRSSLACFLFGFSAGVVATALYSRAYHRAQQRRRQWF